MITITKTRLTVLALLFTLFAPSVARAAELAQTFRAAVHALMPAPSPAWGESKEAFEARMDIVAVSVDKAVQKAPPRMQYKLGLAVLTVFWGESRFSPLIHSGAKLGDGGKAICMGQHHQLTRTEEEWRSLAGLDAESTTRCAEATVNALARAWGYCFARDPKATFAEAFVLYGTGMTCRPEESRWKNIFIDRGAKWRSLVFSCGKGPSACLPWGKP